LGTARQTPDIYLDELRETLSTHCGVNVSESTVWRTLRRAGFTMKKVRRACFTTWNVMTVNIYMFAAYTHRSSVPQRSALHILLESAAIPLNRLFSWMKVQLIGEHRIEDTLGQFEEHKHSAKLFLYGEEGM
jgi:hypothetical protein